MTKIDSVKLVFERRNNDVVFTSFLRHKLSCQEWSLKDVIMTSYSHRLHDIRRVYQLTAKLRRHKEVSLLSGKVIIHHRATIKISYTTGIYHSTEIP